jgi:hypothetical protein
MKHQLIKYLFLGLLLACTKPESLLKKSVFFAGSNKGELEQLLLHYSVKQSDSLKLRAAEFLISNMMPHYSFESEGMEWYHDAADSIADIYYATDVAVKDYFDLRFLNLPSAYPDLLLVKSDYLIKNIDRAFDDWQNGAWAKHLDFEQFCEYLLPYKVCELQTLDDWREYLATAEFGDLQTLSYNTANHSSFRATERVVQSLFDKLPKTPVKNDLPVIRRMSSLVKSIKTKDCEDYSIETTAVLRAKGIPAAIDFTPQWANARLGHEWCVLIDNFGKNVPLDISVGKAGTVICREMSKVYRRTWAINQEILELNSVEASVPALFKNPCIKDVTAEYQTTSDLKIKIEKTDRKYAYLCTFNDTEWNPIAFGKIKGNKAQFEKIGRDVIYIVATMENDVLKTVSQPFLLDLRGNTKQIESDAKQRQTLKLYRKHPASFWWAYDANRVMGSEFQAANRSDFSDAVTVHTIESFGTESGEVIPFQGIAGKIPCRSTGRNDGKYRYWRHLSAPEGFGAMAEVYFLRNGKNITDKGTVIGVKGQHENSNPANVFDNNPVTFYDAPAPSGCWIGVDFGFPVTVDKILYIPKSDGNGITFSDEYELKYWGNNRWNSLGRKIADNIFVEFENCPSGALFWLHDCTRGVEDRIFTYENWKQVFY